MNRLLAGVLVAVVAFGGGYALHGERIAAAESASAGDSPALKLSKLVLNRDTYKDLIQQTSAGIILGIKNSGQTLPKDFEKKMPAIISEVLPYDDMLQLNAQIYGSRFSEKEISDIIAFYKTPTGAKLVKELPGISRDAAAKVGGLMPQRLPAVMKKHGLAP